MNDLRRFSSLEDLYNHTVLFFLESAEKSISNKGVFHAAISGGSTPLPFFSLLSRKKFLFKKWDKINFFWVDERWVPITSAESNYGNALSFGLKDIPSNFFKFDTQAASPNETCKQYEKILMKNFHGTPAFDFLLLGVGTDGHTASIFQKDLANKNMYNNYALVTEHPTTYQKRLTLSIAALQNAIETCVLVCGGDKKGVLDYIINNKEPHYPIQTIITASRNVSILTDIHE